MLSLQSIICRRLQIDHFQYVEIESKKKIQPEQRKDIRKFLLKKKKVQHVKRVFFFDQYLDTPKMDLLKIGASMRLRYKKNGSLVYLQYKGPGYLEDGLLYRSEFSSGVLKNVALEESHHDVIRFTKTSFQNILAKGVPRPMAAAMKRHLGAAVLEQISVAPIICMYQKDKFLVDLGSAFLEPSLDRIFAFHINKTGMHPLSVFSEYENEIKAKDKSLNAKLDHLPELLKFDRLVAEEFDLQPERLDKYHRSSSIFLPHNGA